MNRFVLATHNEGKKVELLAILREVIDGVEIVTSGELNLPDVVEDGLTFSENALIKARAAAKESGLPAIADDSGIVVDILGAAPGILSARWAGAHGDDTANLELLLAQMADIPDAGRSARFVCAAACVTPAGAEVVAHGDMPGTVLRAPVGDGGFGYDPIFCPEGTTVSVAQLTREEKNAISHRGKAFRALAAKLVSSVVH